ncbi:MAG: hypothetical protein LBS91_03665, partial [Clostridiales Family XIII bacterium]|nr:hypothetical protein [Clostridiales Family XIII bacterium]
QRFWKVLHKVFLQISARFEKHHYRNDGQLACNSMVSEQLLSIYRCEDFNRKKTPMAKEGVRLCEKPIIAIMALLKTRSGTKGDGSSVPFCLWLTRCPSA